MEASGLRDQLILLSMEKKIQEKVSSRGHRKNFTKNLARMRVGAVG